MTFGDLLKKITVLQVYTEQDITLMKHLWQFGRPNSKEWRIISKNVQFRHKNGHKSAILNFF